MDVKKILNDLKMVPEMEPDKHDGCYELMRGIVKSYSNLISLDNCSYKDLNAIYAMVLGTWKLNVEKKKEYVNATCLNSNDKVKMNRLIDIIWDNACYSKYENREKGNPSIGLFGTGFYSFQDASDEDSRRFIQMLIDIEAESDEDRILEIAAKALSMDIKGMGAASASVILHGLNPFVFPIMNGNNGHGNLVEVFGVKLNQPGKLTHYIENSKRIKEFRDRNLPFKNYRILDRWAWKLDEYDKNESEVLNETVPYYVEPLYDHNLILYGPPGTGKTYNTVIYAVAIIEKAQVEDIKEEALRNYQGIKARYERYKKEGKIAFTTFHQSYGYEEFIEGIRPAMSDDETDVEYSIEPGVFKSFCERAATSKDSKEEYDLNDNPTVWKVSLAGTHENPVREECLKNSHIRIGWDEYGEDLSEEAVYEFGGKNPLNAFINKMRIGDIVFSCYSSTIIDAIGVVTGEYRWDDSFDSYKRVRDVKWIVKNIKEDIFDINNGSVMTLSTVYKMKASVADVMRIVRNYNGDIMEDNNDDNYVFIIDEINRGNISKIFGELITLIEETKRSGASESMEVTLPYSGTSFSVPNNVYIIGTMNTADRSIALMDTALRRRFSFKEMMPESNVLKNLRADMVDNLDVARMLDTINNRIAFLYDREHTIGHAFFTGLKDEPTIDKLADIFSKSIIPLLQEYFYEDYQKIQLVLGDNKKSDEKYKFIKDTSVPKDLFKGNVDDIVDIPEKKYEINKDAFYELQSYIEIM